MRPIFGNNIAKICSIAIAVLLISATLAVAVPAVNAAPGGKPSFNYSMTINPNAITVSKGSSGTSNISIAGISGSGTVNLSLSGVPAGVDATLSKSSGKVSSSTGFSSILLVKVTNSAQPGTHSITVTGSGKGVIKNVTLQLTIPTPPNGNPLANPDAATTMQGVAVTINVLSNDSDPDGDTLSISSVGTPSNGVANSDPDKTITYTPNSGFFGTDSFTYSISDGKGGTASSTVTVTVNATPPNDPVIMAAGDIACDPLDSSYNGGSGTSTACRMLQTSDILVNASDLDAVLTLGDNQYPNGELSKYLQSYDPTWGREKPSTFPTPGNHEYGTPGATGYYSYFGALAGDPSKGYYSYDIGSWHIIALNSNCSAIGGCGNGSPQEVWLESDLAAHTNSCTLAYWHHPRFSSGSTHGNNATYDAFWQDLYAAGADVVLAGHEHNYERFAPMNPSGSLDTTNGIREFVVGSGGKSHYGFGTPLPTSEVRNGDTFGVLQLTLHPNSYDWVFVPEAGKTFTDSGTSQCH